MSVQIERNIVLRKLESFEKLNRSLHHLYPGAHSFKILHCHGLHLHPSNVVFVFPHHSAAPSTIYY